MDRQHAANLNSLLDALLERYGGCHCATGGHTGALSLKASISAAALR